MRLDDYLNYLVENYCTILKIVYNGYIESKHKQGYNMKLQTQAGLFYITGKVSELEAIKKVCQDMKSEMGDDMHFCDVSEGNKIEFECGYKFAYYTIQEVKEMFKHAKKGV
jgi:hypothetical protein